MDGEFRAVFQSKNPSVPQAVAIVLEEIDRIRTEPVSEKEIAGTRIEGRSEHFLWVVEGGEIGRYVGDGLVVEVDEHPLLYEVLGQ